MYFLMWILLAYVELYLWAYLCWFDHILSIAEYNQLEENENATPGRLKKTVKPVPIQHNLISVTLFNF